MSFCGAAPGPGPFAEFLALLRQKLGWFNQRVPNARVFVVTDKTLYSPGESTWLSAFVREGAALMRGTHNFARLSAARGDISEVERRENAAGLTRTIERAEVDGAAQVADDGVAHRVELQ